MTADSGRRTAEWKKLKRQRLTLAAARHEPCWRCGQAINYTTPWKTPEGKISPGYPVCGHLQDVVHTGLEIVPLDQLAPEHWRCSTRAGRALQVVPDKTTPTRDQTSARRAKAPFPGTLPSGPGPEVPYTHPGGVSVPAFPPPTDPARFTAPWVADLLAERPENARVPRWMTDVHPEAVGSYGESMTRWAADEMGIRLRWFQRLSNARQLEHRADGSLCWRYTVESTPRRVGKSVRLKALAGWRLDHADLLGEVQTVLFTGKDLPICKEIHSSAWAWAIARGWTVSRGMGNEAITASDGSRWLVRSQNGVYGYPAGLALCDEAWKVPPNVIGEGLQPALMDRANPQLLLTSTAHTQSTPLMRRRIRDALAELTAPGSTLLMLWGADPATAADDPLAAAGEASPHTDPQREELVADAWRDALSGVADPEFEEADPVAGFLAQYANVWPALDARPDVGTPLVSRADWGDLALPEQVGGGWAVAAVEAAYGFPPVVVLARRLDDGRALLSAVACVDTADAARVCRAAGVGAVLVGKSLLRDSAPWVGLPVEARSATSAQAVAEVGRLLKDQVLAHDGGALLAGQVLDVRTETSPAGVRLVSDGRVDAIKAAGWAAQHARADVPWFVL